MSTYNTKASKIHRDYQGDSRYKSDYVLDEDVISADSLEGLYEAAAEYNERWLALVESGNKANRYFDSNDYRVDFSEVYVIIEEFDLAKLKATKTYSERTLIREAAVAEAKAESARLAKIREEYEATQREERERLEYIRLTKKFAK